MSTVLETVNRAAIGSRTWAIAARSSSITRSLLMHKVLTMLCLFGIVVAIQIVAGAYQTERGNFSDEAAHFMNGMLVRDYLRDALGQNPIRFAEQYYLNYPKIAPMMWPPLFHIVLGVLMLPGWAPQTIALLLIAFAASWTAWRLFRIVEQTTNGVAAYVSSALFIATTLIIDMTSVVMLDMVVAAFALEAAYWFSKFLSSGRRRDAIVFGILAACCCLTKGNGLSILLLPPVAILLTGEFRLLRSRSIWFAAAIVFLIALPVLLYSFLLDSPMGGYVYIRSSQVFERAVYYANHLWKQLGTLVILCAGLGFVAKGWCFPSSSRGRCATSACMAALFLSAFAFHVVTPHESFGLRYMALSVAPVLALCAIGVTVFAHWLRPSRWRAAQIALLVAIVVNFSTAKPAIASRGPLGYREAATYLDGRYGLKARRLVVVSNETGEGAMVTEVAARQILPVPTMIRGSKLIAFEDWNGGQFRMNFDSPAALLQELEDLHVDFLVVDESAVLPYSPLVGDMLHQYPGHFELDRRIDRGRTLKVYRLLVASPGPAKKVQAEVGALKRVLTQE